MIDLEQQRENTNKACARMHDLIREISKKPTISQTEDKLEHFCQKNNIFNKIIQKVISLLCKLRILKK